MEKTITSTETAINDYRDTLLDIERATDRLLAAIIDWDAEQVERCIASREALCSQIGQHTADLMATFPSVLPPETSELQNIFSRLAGKQASCESALAAGLAECRQELLSLNKGKSVMNTYRLQTESPQAKFLDSWL